MHVIVRVRRNPPNWDPPLTLRRDRGENRFAIDDAQEVEIRWGADSVSFSCGKARYELPLRHETRGLNFNSIHAFVEVVPDQGI